MLIYNYADGTNEYTGSKEARLDPLETIRQGIDVYLYPRNSTIIAPPACRDNEVAIFKDNQWLIKKDYRDEYWYDTEFKFVLIDFIGDPKERNLFNPQELPVHGENETLVYDKDWKVVKDYREQTWYTKKGEPVFIIATGDPHELGLMTKEEYDSLPPLPKPVPVLTAVQLRLQLLTHNIADADVDATINSSKLNDRQKKELVAFWHYSLDFTYTNKMLVTICTLLGITDLEKEFRSGALLGH